MTLADAQSAVADGSPLGAVYGLIPEADRDALKAWFVADPGVPLNPTRPVPPAAPHSSARDQGYTGDECGQCGSMRMRRNGACLLCDACGTTSGCS